MDIHVVSPGDTLFSISRTYGVPQALIALWNSLSFPYSLTVDQALLILYPERTYTVSMGDTPQSVANKTGITLKQLYQRNPGLYGGLEPLYPGQTLVISFEGASDEIIRANAYAYPFIDERVMYQTLPYLEYFTPFTYGFTPSGTLLGLDDERLLGAARVQDVLPLMHLSTLTENGNFSNELASALLSDVSAQNRLIGEILSLMREKDYYGLDIDFEFIFPEDALPYAEFISRARQSLGNYPVFAALAPKTSAAQPGLLYEGHNYAAVGEAADFVFLMTYEWGYTYGPPMAVAPLPSVRRVVDYAVSEIPASKMLLGIPNYGYDWALPYKSGDTRATLISNEEAVRIAYRYGVPIKFDEISKSPYFNYYDGTTEHEVWFEDVRSIMGKLALAREYGFYGIGYWNAMRPFTQNWMLLSGFPFTEST